jgi:PST family polysaccharide transporter
VAVLVASPYLFEFAFHSKFAGGLAVLPWTLAYCNWSGMNGVAQNYLWCAEKARLGCLALLVGLCISIGLNLVLLPRFGLHGAVWATSAANFVALGLVYAMNYWSGMRVDRGTLLLSLLPLGLVMGPLVACGVLVLVSAIAVATNWFFNADEKQHLLSAAQGYLSKLERFRWRKRVRAG